MSRPHERRVRLSTSRPRQLRGWNTAGNKSRPELPIRSYWLIISITLSSLFNLHMERMLYLPSSDRVDQLGYARLAGGGGGGGGLTYCRTAPLLIRTKVFQPHSNKSATENTFEKNIEKNRPEHPLNKHIRRHMRKKTKKQT